MGKILAEKANRVFGPRGPITPGPKPTGRDEGGKPKTAIGAMAQFTDRQSAAIKEAAELKAQLKEFEGSIPARRIDPRLIVRSKWANRHDLSFSGADFDALKDDINAQGGNVQPIKVRPLANDPGRYEIIFGHRRHQASLELGLPVLAIIEQLDEKNLFIEMDRENRQRKDLSPYETGAMYAKALDEGLFPSARKLAEEVGMDQSQLSKALNLARLPADILHAFQSPLDLQYRWVADLVGAIQKDPDRVINAAKAISALELRPSSADVFKQLTASHEAARQPAEKVDSVQGRGAQKAEIRFDGKKKSIRIDISNVDASRLPEIKAAIKALIS